MTHCKWKRRNHHQFIHLTTFLNKKNLPHMKSLIHPSVYTVILLVISLCNEPLHLSLKLSSLQSTVSLSSSMWCFLSSLYMLSTCSILSTFHLPSPSFQHLQVCCLSFVYCSLLRVVGNHTRRAPDQFIHPPPTLPDDSCSLVMPFKYHKF